MKITNDLAYGGDMLHKLDVYQPEKPNGYAVMYIHGGGWSQGDKGKEIKIATLMTNEGFTVFVPNYRLAVGETKTNLFPTQRDDVFMALKWILMSDYTINIEKMAVWGSSAGGNLAVEVGIEFKIPVVNWSGLNAMDLFLEEHKDTIAHKMNADPNTPSALIDQDGENAGVYKWAISNLFGNDFENIKSANPIYRVNKETKPMFIANSIHELVPLKELYLLQQALALNEIASQSLILPGSRHAEGYMDIAYKPSIQFLADYFEGKLNYKA